MKEDFFNHKFCVFRRSRNPATHDASLLRQKTPKIEKGMVRIMNGISGFHTQKSSDLPGENGLTATMEDYLEMVCRLSANEGHTRVQKLAGHLNVKPSSVSKMVDHLKALGFLSGEKYGCIRPTPLGQETGDYLLYRHDLLNRFLCYINNSTQELEQVEKIEHFIDKRTVESISNFLKIFSK